jgi:hypothetical protein
MGSVAGWPGKRWVGCEPMAGRKVVVVRGGAAIRRSMRMARFGGSSKGLASKRMKERAAYTGAREPEQAAEVAIRALTIGRQTSSARILGEMVQVDQHLAPAKSLGDAE